MAKRIDKGKEPSLEVVNEKESLDLDGDIWLTALFSKKEREALKGTGGRLHCELEATGGAVDFFLKKIKANVRYNKRSGSPEINAEKMHGVFKRQNGLDYLPGSNVWVPLATHGHGKLDESLQTAFEYLVMGKKWDSRRDKFSHPVRLSFTEKDWRREVVAASSRRKIYDPWFAYAKTIKPLMEKPDFDPWAFLNKAFKSMFDLPEKSKLNDWILPGILTGTLKRTFDPGCHIRVMAVLRGIRRSGKSSFYASILPPHMQHMYLENFHLSEDFSREIRKTNNKSIVHIPEMDRHLKAGAADRFVSNMDQSVDTMLILYVNDSVQHPRDWLFVGSANYGQTIANMDALGDRLGPADVAAKKGKSDVPRNWMNKKDGANLKRDMMWAAGLLLLMAGCWKTRNKDDKWLEPFMDRLGVKGELKKRIKKMSAEKKGLNPSVFDYKKYGADQKKAFQVSAQQDNEFADHLAGFAWDKFPCWVLQKAMKEYLQMQFPKAAKEKGTRRFSYYRIDALLRGCGLQRFETNKKIGGAPVTKPYFPVGKGSGSSGSGIEDRIVKTGKELKEELSGLTLTAQLTSSARKKARK